MENYLDDRVVIPEEIKRMTKEQRIAEIQRLEAIAAAEKQRILDKKRMQNNT